MSLTVSWLMSFKSGKPLLEVWHALNCRRWDLQIFGCKTRPECCLGQRNHWSCGGSVWGRWEQAQNLLPKSLPPLKAFPGPQNSVLRCGPISLLHPLWRNWRVRSFLVLCFVALYRRGPILSLLKVLISKCNFLFLLHLKSIRHYLCSAEELSSHKWIKDLSIPVLNREACHFCLCILPLDFRFWLLGSLKQVSMGVRIAETMTLQDYLQQSKETG